MPERAAAVKPPEPRGELVHDILAWCRHFPLNEDTLWRLSALADKLAVPEHDEATLATLAVVLRARLAAAHCQASDTGACCRTILRTLDGLALARPDRRGIADRLAAGLLTHPATFEEGSDEHDPRLTYPIVWVTLDRARCGLLDKTKADGREVLDRLLNWLERLAPQHRTWLRVLLGDAREVLTDDLLERYEVLVRNPD
jgi:hypothetical protein